MPPSHLQAESRQDAEPACLGLGGDYGKFGLEVLELSGGSISCLALPGQEWKIAGVRVKLQSGNEAQQEGAATGGGVTPKPCPAQQHLLWSLLVPQTPPPPNVALMCVHLQLSCWPCPYGPPG